jgi:hypothetical protein
MTASNIPPSEKEWINNVMSILYFLKVFKIPIVSKKQEKLSHGETIIELNGTSSHLSNLVLSIVRDLATFRKSLPKFKQVCAFSFSRPYHF